MAKVAIVRGGDAPIYCVKHAYALLADVAAFELEANVSVALRDGWQLCGGASVIYENGRWHMFQAVTKAA